MKDKKVDLKELDTESVENELNRVKYKRRFNSTLRSTIYALITVAATAVLVSMLFLPVLQIYGSSMTPSITDGDIVVAVKGSKFETGEVVAFYYNNKILIKRVIAQAGDWVDMTEEGDVIVNNEVLEEPYILDKDFGETNIKLPYQVPEGRIFVMGDHRAISIDSRNTTVGPVAQEQIVGKVKFRIWPLNQFGFIK